MTSKARRYEVKNSPASAFALHAVGVAVFLSGYLGAVADQKTREAGELISRRRDDLNNQRP
ncbi:hypothetical protein AAU01_24500 [Paenarthrobacter aurescens]|uniref:Uncharacterized protein n=1 Tax=Paenarthrobacter aurescens TaxID=43663 RepID=A0A4Y3NGU6_PAEAU|nr:hypothetical protein AAU01_24500 [Paenarthrobacter aurescens]